MDECPYKVGQWVRFYSDGQLVIGVIQYICREQITSIHRWSISTDIGMTSEVEILEAR